jgi:hypothetical protein
LIGVGADDSETRFGESYPVFNAFFPAPHNTYGEFSTFFNRVYVLWFQVDEVGHDMYLSSDL